jgi:CheY-like chemotaxis protein
MSRELPTVLVVDDNEPVREFIKYILEMLSPKPRVLLADTNKRALQLCLENTVDLVTTDLIRPNSSGSGVALVKRLRTEFPKIHVVVVSAWSNVEQNQFDLCVCCIKKPFDIRELLVAIAVRIGCEVAVEVPKIDYEEMFKFAPTLELSELPTIFKVRVAQTH